MPQQPVSPQYPSLHHVGVVVRDMDQTGRDNAARFGLGDIVRRTTMHVENALYRGERVSYSAAFGFVDLGNAAIQIIQPIGTRPSPYREALSEQGENTHHLAFVVPSIDAQLERARKANPALTLVLDAALPDGQGRFVYVEGLVRGARVELIEFAR